MLVIGTLVSAVGYVAAIGGAWLLYRNATPDFGYGTVPVLESGESEEFFPKQQLATAKRRSGNRTGFGLLLVGSVLQLTGTLIGGLFSTVG